MSLTRLAPSGVAGVAPLTAQDIGPFLGHFDGLRRWAPSDQLNLSGLDAEIEGFLGDTVSYGNNIFLPGSYETGSQTNGKQPMIDLDDWTVGGSTFIDLATLNSAAIGYASCFSDGAYCYYVPGYSNQANTRHGQAARVPLDDFQIGSAEIINLATAHVDLVGGVTGFYDEVTRHAYFISGAKAAPGGARTGIIGRVPVDNFTAGAVEALDITAVNADLVGLYYAIKHKRYVYLLTVTDDIVVRFNLDDYSTNGIDFISLGNSITGLRGGFIDGTYLYIIANGGNKICRIPFADFSTANMTVLDLSAVDSDYSEPFKGVTVGRYAYVICRHDSSVANCIIKIDLINFEIVDRIITTDEDSDAKGFYGLLYKSPYLILSPFAPASGQRGGPTIRISVEGHSEVYT